MRFNRFSLRLRAVERVAVMMAFLLGVLPAAPAADVEIKGGPTSKRYYYPPPNEQQLHIEVVGSSGANIPNHDGKVLLDIKGARIKEYTVKGALKLTAEAPDCLFDAKNQEASSAGPLQIRTEDGLLFVEGTGFFLSQSNSMLTISNHAHSIFELPAGTNGTTAKTEIFANSGVFRKNQTNDSSAIYRGAVRVNQPKMNLTCELLTANLTSDPNGQTNRIIIAETNVVLDSVGETGEQMHATSQRAVYRYDAANADTNEIVELTESPRVDFTNGWMTADRIFLNQSTHKMQARDQVHFHYLPQTASAKKDSPTEAAKEIHCDLFDYDLTTRQADFTGNVRENDDKANIAAEFATTVLPKSEPGKTNHLDQLLAKTNVVIEFQDSPSAPKIHATGQQAVYHFQTAGTTTNQTVVLTGNPTVQSSKYNGWMTADTITVDRAQQRVWGTGNHHSVFKRPSDELALLDTEIFSDRFDFSMATGLSIYHDNVRVFDPDLNTTGKTGTIKITKMGSTNYYVERAQMDDSVTLDFIGKAFAPGDFTNLNAIALRLQQPTARDGIAQFIAAQLGTNTQTLLTKFVATQVIANPQALATNHHGELYTNLQAALATNFNRIIRSGPVYDPVRLEGVYLSLDTSARMRAQPLGVDLIELNRQILLDAFNAEISRNPDGEIIHATGDHGIYTKIITATATNSTVKLTGHPQVIQPNSTTTAQDSMMADLVTGKFWLVGRPYFKTRLVGVDAQKLSGSPKKNTN